MANLNDDEFDQDVVDEAFELYGFKHEAIDFDMVLTQKHRDMLRLGVRLGQVQTMDGLPIRLVKE